MQPLPLRAVALGLAVGATILSGPVRAEDQLLSEVVDFTGTVLYLESGVPGLVIGAVRDGETAVAGFGDADGKGTEPDGDTILHIGSVTKVFTGQVLASLVVDGTVSLTDRLQDRIGWDVTMPARDGHEIRLIDLATHTSGLPREMEREPGPPDNPNSTLVPETYIAALNRDPLLFTPGTGALYSNFAYDLLGAALAHTAGMPYDKLLRERVLDALDLDETHVFLPQADKSRLLQGHTSGGQPFPDYPSPAMVAGSGSLYSTTNDMLKFLSWHLDRFSSEDAEVRLLDHAVYVQRDNLSPVYGLDESGHMDAMGLGWVVMMPERDRPLLLQKAGGYQGVFTYCAFAPTRRVGAFVAINKFDFGAAMSMTAAINDMIATIAPR